MKKLTRFIFILLFVIFLQLLIYSQFSVKPDAPGSLSPSVFVQETGRQIVFVSKVIDGDTIELSDGRKVRYIGIDAPEMNECFTRESIQKNAELVLHKQIELQKDISNTDKFGRLLRYVFLVGEEKSINEVLVSEGYAVARSYRPDISFQENLSQAERQARGLQKGMWESCTM